MPELIVMLTQNDRTVPNAPEVFEACADSRAKLWGFKEEGLPLPEMKRLYARMKDCSSIPRKSAASARITASVICPSSAGSPAARPCWRAA